MTYLITVISDIIKRDHFEILKFYFFKEKSKTFKVSGIFQKAAFRIHDI